MIQPFNSKYATRLDFAKAAAKTIIGQLNTQKDVIGVVAFDALNSTVVVAPNAHTQTTSAAVDVISSQAQKTTFYTAFKTAIDALNLISADKRIIILISDGEDQQGSYLTNNPISLLNTFKSNGGIVMCLGARASGTDNGFLRLESFSTGGFFVNAYGSGADDALTMFTDLKGYVCAGNCAPVGDIYEPTPRLNYSSFQNWDVIAGTIDLIGPGLFDVLPGNGLYIALDSPACSLLSKSSYTLTSGKTYRIRLSLAGNQKIDNGAASITISIGSAFSHTVVVTDFTQVFTSYSFNFTVASTVTGKISITSTIGDATIADWGLLVDSILLDGVTDGVALFEETFGQENIQYVPPRCGVGTTYVPTNAGAESLTYTTPTYKQIAFGGPEPDAVEQSVGVLSTGGDYRIEVSAFNPSYANVPIATIFTAGMQMKIKVGGTDYTGWFGIMGLIPSDGPVLNSTLDGYLTNLPAGASVYVRVGIIDPSTDNFVAGTFALDGAIAYPLHFSLKITSLTGGSGYGYMTGYNCYGEGCLSEPPPAQLPDPSPLPDIESGYVPPTIYNSTKTVCVACQTGFANFPVTNLVPVMTSDTAPSGVAAASTEAQAPAFLAFIDASHRWYSDAAAPQWVSYQFAATTEVDFYAITAPKAGRGPKAWELQGSNDGTTWTALDSQLNVTWFNGETKRFALESAQTYQFFRLYISDVQTNTNGNGPMISGLSLFGSVPVQACATRDGTSTKSQAEADTRAQTAAHDDAQIQLNCIQQFGSSETYKSKCPTGTFGNEVSETRTATSFNSQKDADDAATAAAKAAAEAAMDCSLSNNTNVINIPAIGSGGQQGIADPYPSVQHISGKPVGIAKIVVTVKNLSHASANDIVMVLRGPDGTACYLMANCGGFTSIPNVVLVFDDAASTYKPTRYTPVTALPDPGPQTIGTTLSVFNGVGKDPNGSWSLWIVDDTAVNIGAITGGFEVTVTSS
jgi:hypothetical protein